MLRILERRATLGTSRVPLLLTAVRYTKGMFWMDLAAALPWDLLMRAPMMALGFSPIHASIFGLLRMLRMYRV